MLFIHRIKELQDGDSACSEILDDLIKEWNLRLRLVQSSARTVEPVLRLRRILLEQSKVSTHFTTYLFYLRTLVVRNHDK